MNRACSPRGVAPRPVARALVAALLTALAAACSGPADQPDTAAVAPARVPPAPAQPSVPARPNPTEECRPGPGRQVEELPDVRIAAIRQPATAVPEREVGGERVPGVAVGAVDVPAQVADAGCIVRHDAPAGCLGAIEITEAVIPAVELPGYTMPGFTLDGRQVDEVTVAPARAEEVVVPAVRTEQVCQQRPSEDTRYLGQVYRPQLYRSQGYRPQAFRSAGRRAAAHVDAERNVPSVNVASVAAPSVALPGVTVPSAIIGSVVLDDADGTEVFRGQGGEDVTAYSTQDDVLFDFGLADINPGAVATLRAIATDLEDRIPGKDVRVDGHTDAIGTDADNLDLSTRRADAVKRWLSTEGGIDASRIRTTGYGEAAPVAPNEVDGADNPEGRAENRRVVIAAGRRR